MHCMDYHRCSIEALHHELNRRQLSMIGNHDLLSERLRATTLITSNLTAFAARESDLMRTVEFGRTVPATQLVNQRIVYWNLNTFFPTLQLFFESGLSCTLDGGQLPDAVVGLDPQLRFRLTDCTHQEQGRITKSIFPESFGRSGAGMRIIEATIAQRTSITTKPRTSSSSLAGAQYMDITHETHAVVGLRLRGMSEIGYIWAKIQAPSTQAGGRQWGDVRLAGLRDDVPAPFFGHPVVLAKPGTDLTVVEKGSMMSPVTNFYIVIKKPVRPCI